ncbi:MAG: hypothetical protein WAL34_00010 [Acidobacteriaceae bacterium]
MKYTILFQRSTVDISVFHANPMLAAPHPARHLLVNPHDDTAVCGYRWRPGDTLDGSYIDPGSIACTKCANETNKS